MALHPGTVLGHYEVLSALGAGGMGEVWRARDTRLDREVALKVLPEAFLSDRERASRFEREAKVLASLDHPNIGGIHGVEEADGVKALVLELVEGPTLADRIAEGPLPLGEALAIARQIVDALDAAHEQGIVHRDLKPANVKVRPDGRVKVLDFGLAKALEPQARAPSVSASPTLSFSAAATQMGVVLGTAAYMAPEQARGRPVDKRADIWAFGCVLYEMLVGRRPFEGDDVSDLLVAVLSKEPDWTALEKRAPERVARLVRRCLEKDPRRRLRDVADARPELEEAVAAPAVEPAPVSAAPRRTSRLSIVITAGACLAVGAAGSLLVAGWLRPAREPAPLARFVLEAPAKEAGAPLRPHSVAIAHDASVMVYDTGVVPSTTIRARRLDQLEGVPLRGVEAGALQPFLSPDDRWVGYADFVGGTLRKISILGGPSVTLCKFDKFPIGASWGPNDTIVFGQMSGPLRRVPAAGGEPQDLTQLAEGEVSHRFPEFLPGGDAVLFAAFASNDPKTAAIHVFSLSTGEGKVLLAGATRPRYASSGHLMYAVGTTLFAVAFDPRRLEVTGDPVPVVEGASASSFASSHYAVSMGGALVYVSGGAVEYQLVWVDREGREEPIGAPPGFYVYPRLSPDGTKVALAVGEVDPDIWIWDLERETFRRLTLTPGADSNAVWSPDGRTVFFASARENGGADIVGRLADGMGEPRRLTSQQRVLLPMSVTPDGAGLVVSSIVASNQEDILWVDSAGKAEPRMLLDAASRLSNPAVSPDGRWLAYESNESGASQIFVRPFPALDSGGWQVSSGGGTRPLWSRDGRELFYLDASGFLTAVAIERREDALSIGSPQVVIRKAYIVAAMGRTYDVSPDGRRFLMITSKQDDAVRRIVLVQNWFDELRRLAPVRGH